MKIIERYGYGATFNDLIIEDDKITKVCKNEDGIQKIKNEIAFYDFVKKCSIDFPVVDIVGHVENGYIMKYLKDYIPLYKSQNLDVNMVYDKLKVLHDSYNLKVTKEYFISQLRSEIETKILTRYKMIESMVREYDFIKKVNGVNIMKFEELHKKIVDEIYKEVNSLEQYAFVPIHGDCQFNNILVKGESMVFIDPRGYFGKSSIFGMKEYDMAKVLFAISGYDEFDARLIESVDIYGDEIKVELNGVRTDIFNRPRLEVLLMLNIWLGNAHSFADNKYKMLYSYFISLYLGSLYFSKK